MCGAEVEMVICPETGYSGVDISEYCLICGKLNHNRSKPVSEKSVKKKQAALSGFGVTAGRGKRRKSKQSISGGKRR